MTIRNTAFHEATDALLADDADELTGQLSRVRFMEALDGMIAHVDATGRSCGLLIASIDNMALINEAFGFEIGDRVIAATGAILKTDMRSGDAIGRYSGNKFGIIVNDCDPEELQNVANRLIRAVREANGQRGLCPLSATLSIGGVLVPDVARTAHKALCGALQALEGAKVERHERFRPFETDPGRAAARRRNVSVAAEVVSALDEDRMRLALQPVVDSRTGEPVFYEALMRMEQPDGTVVSAGDFVEIVERLGFSRLIDLRTLTLAVDILRENPDLKLALNVSALTCGEQDWIRQLRALTADAPELCRRLIVEITETAAIEDLDQSIVFVDTLKELGCMVALDDFGSGYTSFTTLKHLSVDIIKIDGAFVKDLDHDGKDAVFLKMMVSLADSLGMKSVAEWVGSEATARIVAAAGVTYMQGFHYGEAQTPQALSKAGLCGAGQ